MLRVIVICIPAALFCLVCDRAHAEVIVSFTTPTVTSVGVPAVFGADISREVVVQNVPGWSLIGPVDYSLVGITILPMPNGGFSYAMYMYSHTQQYAQGVGKYQYNVFRNLGGNPLSPNKTYFSTFEYTP